MNLSQISKALKERARFLAQERRQARERITELEMALTKCQIDLAAAQEAATRQATDARGLLAQLQTALGGSLRQVSIEGTAFDAVFGDAPLVRLDSGATVKRDKRR